MALITFEDLPSTNTPINATDLNTIQLEEYSTTEKIIGVWHDGRTIYRKVVRFNPDDSALATYTNHNISTSALILYHRKSTLSSYIVLFTTFLTINPSS